MLTKARKLLTEAGFPGSGFTIKFTYETVISGSAAGRSCSNPT
jgi:hypothetical protein